MKKILFLTVTMLVMQALYSENMNKYTANETEIVQTGTKDGQLGIAIVPEGQLGALTFAVSMKNIFVADSANKRLNIYDLSLAFIKSIKNTQNNKIGFAERIIINNNNILYFKHDFGLTLTDNDGEIIVHRNAKELPDEVKHRYNAFLLANKIYIYDDSLAVRIIEGNETIENREKIAVELQNLEKDTIQDLMLTEDLRLSEKPLSTLQSIKNEGKYLIIGDRFFSNNFKQHQEYYNRIAGVRQYARSLRLQDNLSQDSGENTQESIDVDINAYYPYFIGYDDSHNSYWRCESKKETDNTRKEIIVVYSRYGELLDAFQYGALNKYEPDLEQYPTSGAKVAVAPNGDLWFMQGSAKGYFFYKIPRVW